MLPYTAYMDPMGIGSDWIDHGYIGNIYIYVYIYIIRYIYIYISDVLFRDIRDIRDIRWMGLALLTDVFRTYGAGALAREVQRAKKT